MNDDIRQHLTSHYDSDFLNLFTTADVPFNFTLIALPLVCNQMELIITRTVGRLNINRQIVRLNFE